MSGGTACLASALIAVLYVSLTSSGTVDVTQVGFLVAHMIEEDFATCHLVLMTTDPHSLVFSAVQRQVLQK